ncbi:MAG: hypothetical protein SFU98_12265 [Leptospiraceae bacterium]|nr:hypothetical protein [Leptospiraceae bacterium]
MKPIPLDTNGNKKDDTIGYYIDTPGNYRVVYQELDSDENGKSEIFVWHGLSSVNTPEQAEKQTIKVHEEEDTNGDGKIDLVRWLLPNEFIAIVQRDNDFDEYLETTNYYNSAKQIVRSEVDSDKDGKPDKIFWTTRAEVDTNRDGIPDKFTLGNNEAEIREKVNTGKDLKPLKQNESWILNPNLVPTNERPILNIQ